MSATARFSSRTIETLSNLIALPCFEATRTNVLPSTEINTEMTLHPVSKILEALSISEAAVLSIIGLFLGRSFKSVALSARKEQKNDAQLYV